MALVVGFILFLVLEPPLGALALAGGALIEVGELYLWTRYLRRFRVSTGPEGLIGERGTALEGFAGSAEGEVRVRGELWRARAAGKEGGGRDGGALRSGDEVEVVAIKGLTLTVRPTGRSGSHPTGSGG